MTEKTTVGREYQVYDQQLGSKLRRLCEGMRKDGFVEVETTRCPHVVHIFCAHVLFGFFFLVFSSSYFSFILLF